MAKLAQRSMQLKAPSPAARVQGTGADSQLRPVAGARGRGGAQVSLVADVLVLLGRRVATR